jgi:hypothetical protein
LFVLRGKARQNPSAPLKTGPGGKADGNFARQVFFFMHNTSKPKPEGKKAFCAIPADLFSY